MEIKLVSMGFNTNHSSPEWPAKVAAFKQAVEEHGEAEAYWGVTGRAAHRLLALELQEELRDEPYEWTISYESYLCRARRI